MSLASLLTAVLLVASTVPVHVQLRTDVPRAPLTRLKPADTEMRRLVTEGYERSATFRELVTKIHQSPAVVIVQFGDCANGRIRSCVSNVSGDDRQRNIRVKIGPRTSHDRLIATIAHELQHVVEIMSDGGARDADRVLALYRRIGTGRCAQGVSDRCETNAAVAIERLVLEELEATSKR